MSGIIIIAVVLIAFVAFTMMHGQANSGGGSRRNQDKADALIGRAESQIMLGQLDAAESSFSQATMLAAGDPLLLSEAHYGLCRVCERRGDLKGAVRQVEASLSYAPQWREFKPNYERLLESEKRRLLDLLSKSL